MGSPQNENLMDEQEKKIDSITLPIFLHSENHLFGSCLLPLITEADGDSLRDRTSTLGLQGGFLFP